MTVQERIAAVEAHYQQLTENHKSIQVELHRLEGEHRLLQAIDSGSVTVPSTNPPPADGPQLTIVPGSKDAPTPDPPLTVGDMLAAGKADEAWLTQDEEPGTVLLQ